MPQSELDKLFNRNTSSSDDNDQESELDKVFKSKPKKEPEEGLGSKIYRKVTESKIFRKATEPQVDVTPTMRQAMDEYSKEHPYLSKIPETVLQSERFAYSPAGVVLGGVSGAAGLALKYGSPKLARVLAKPGLVVGAGTMAHGGYETVKNLSEGKYPEAFGSALETGLGAFATKHARRAYGETLAPEKMLDTWEPGVKTPIPSIAAPPENANLGLGGKIRVNPEQATSSAVAAPVAPIEPGKTPTTIKKPRATRVKKIVSKVAVPSEIIEKPTATEANSQSNIPQETADEFVNRRAAELEEKKAISTSILRKQRQVLINQYSEPELDSQARSDIARQISDIDTQIGKNIKAKNQKSSIVKGEEGAVGPGTSDLVKRNRMRQMIKELDEDKSGDIAYRHAFDDEQPELNAGETWRGRAISFLRGEQSKVEPRTPAQDIAKNAETPSLEAQYNQGRASGKISPTLTFAKWKEGQDQIASLGIEPPKAERKSQSWEEWMKDLDEAKPPVPDTMYRDILSTGGRAELKKGETWRGRVARYIEMDKAAEAKKTDFADRGLRSKDIEPMDLKPTTLPDVIAPPTPKETATVKEPQNWRYDRRGHITGRFLKKDIPVEADMFDRGALEPKEDFTHESFLDSMKKILAGKGKKIITDETGVLSIFGPPKPQHKALRQAVTDWGYGRRKSEVLEPFEAKINEEAQNTKLMQYLRYLGINTKSKSVDSQSIWRAVGDLDAKAGTMMENYYSGLKRWKPGQKGAELTNLTKNINLAQGVFGRSGTLSAHGWNLFDSDYMARGVRKSVGDYIKTTYDPKIDVRYMQENKHYLPEGIENGLDWHGREYSIGTLEEALRKVPGIGKARNLQAKLLEQPLFEVKAPAMQLKQYITKFEELRAKGVDRKEAATRAAAFANDFSGHVNKTFKNKTTWDVAQMLLLAPSWQRSRLNIAAKGLTGHPDYRKPMLRGAALMAATDMISMGLGQSLSQRFAGKPAEVTGIPAGTVETEKDEKGRSITKQRNIEPLGTAVEPHRTIIQNLTQIAKGDIGYPGRYAFNKMSQPAKMIAYLGTNRDPFGNPLTGKDNFGNKIPVIEGILNWAEEVGRPITPGLATALLDYYRGKAPFEEAISRAMGAPITYTSVPKGKKKSSSSRLSGLGNSKANLGTIK